MSAVAGSIVIAIKAVDEASSVFDKVQASMGILGGTLAQLGGPFQGLGSIISGFAAGGPAGAGIAAIGQVVGFLQNSVGAAGAAERVWALLGETVKNQGGDWAALKPNVEATIQSLSEGSKFSMTALADSLQKIVQHGIPATEALKVLKTSMDTAIGSGRDLESISFALGKAFEGNYTYLERLDPSLKAVVESFGKGADKGKVLDAVMEALNKRYSGSAVTDAATYAGTQERLKNAVSELEVKIGSGLTPALTGASNVLIKLVDGFTTGVGAIQNWLGEVAKIPEVKSATDALGNAFAGLQKYFEDAWNSVSKDLMPALNELMGTLHDLWDALKPVFDAFSELMGAFGGSGDSINPLKILLEALVLSIKGLAELIRLIIPVVKLFAQGFKEAADIITPPLKIIGDGVRAFLALLTDVFQAFYDWLVGHSLWQDLWDKVLSIASTIGTTLVTVLQTAFLLWQNVFTIGMAVISSILTTGFTLAFAAVQTIIATGVGLVKTVFQGFVDLVTVGQKNWNDLVASVGSATASMRGIVSDFLGWLSSYWKGQISGIVTSTIDQLAVIVQAMQTAGLNMQATWQTTLDAMVSMEKAAFQAMVNDIQSQLNAIIASLQAAKAAVSGHSIWPDMLNEMVAQTRQGMRAIRDEFSGGLVGPSGIVSIIQSAQPTVAAGVTPAASSPDLSGSQAVTLPINIFVDGQQIQTFIEKRMVNTLRQDASRSRRSGKV